jgi:hypothetical protein
VVQKDVLEKIPGSGFTAYAVWEPILKTDDERSSRKATILFPDDRVSHYWVNNKDVGRLFQGAIDLVSEPAWDVYLVYAPGIRWEGKEPPRPTYFQHQLGGRLPADQRLDGPKLAEAINRAGK